MPYPKYRLLNKKNLKNISINDRHSLVDLKDFPKPYLAGADFRLPEVFLKAVAFCSAQGMRLGNFFTAVFDFNRHYLPFENVFKRPVAAGGKGFYFVGHHEVMIPLLAAMILSAHA